MKIGRGIGKTVSKVGKVPGFFVAHVTVMRLSFTTGFEKILGTSRNIEIML